MQLTLALLEPPDPPNRKQENTLAAKPWDQLDEAAQVTALEILARLIAQMVAAESEGRTSND